MAHRLLRLASAALLATLSTVASLAQAQSDPGMLLALQKLYPTTSFKSVLRTDVPGIFEVTMGGNVAYVDQTGRYFFFGHLYDMTLRQDLTAAKAD